MGTSVAERLSPLPEDRWPGLDTPQRAPGERDAPLQPPAEGTAAPWVWGQLPQVPRKRVSKGQLGDGDSGEVTQARASSDCRCLPRAPAPNAAGEQSPVPTTEQEDSSRVSSHGFIYRALRVRGSRWRRRRRESHREDSSGVSAGPRVPPLLQGMGRKKVDIPPPSVGWLEEVLQVRLPQPLLPLLVLGELPQHGHHVILKFGRRGLCFCGKNRKRQQENGSVLS